MGWQIIGRNLYLIRAALEKSSNFVLSAGRGNSKTFKEIDRITLKEAKELPEYEGLVNSLKSKIERILK